MRLTMETPIFSVVRNYFGVLVAGPLTCLATSVVSTLYGFSAFKLRNNIAYANAGGVADPTPTLAIQLGKYPTPSTNSYSQVVEPDV
jgi:hypothetical protein